MSKYGGVVGFDDVIVVRVRKGEKEAAEDYVRRFPALYDNISHFARSAFLQALRNRAGYVQEDVRAEVRKGGK